MSKKTLRLAALGALALAVLIAVFFLVKDQTAKKTIKIAFTAPTAQPAMSSGAYEDAVRAAFVDFKANDAGSAEAVLNRLSVVSHIPAMEQAAHFAVVSKLTLYAAALRKGSGADQALKDLVAISLSYPWLKAVAPFSSQ